MLKRNLTKPPTTKVVAWAKRLWNRSLTPDDLLYPSDIRICMTDGILRHCKHIGVNPDEHL
jgi:hypothetical protein